MRRRAIGTTLGATCVAAALVVACGTSDPGAVVIEPHHGRSRTGPESDANVFDAPGSPSADASTEGAFGEGGFGEGAVEGALE